jgi:hypothetical protein
LRKPNYRWRLLFKSLLLAVVAAGLFYWLRPSEQKLIRKQFHRLCQAVEKSGEEGNASTTVKMLTLGNLLHEQVDVSIRDFPYNGEQSAETLVSLAMRGRSFFRSISVDVYDLEVILIDEELADLRCVARVSIVSENYHDQDIRHFMASLAKIDKSWVFTGFREDDVLRK